MESVKQRIADLESSGKVVGGLSLSSEFELACLCELVAVTEQRDALVVENAGLKEALTAVIDRSSEPEYHYAGMGCGVEDNGLQTDGYSACEYGWREAMQHVYSEVIPESLPETPATDAARASLRAEGVEMLLTENFKAEIAAALADFDCVDDVTLQTVIWSGQPPEPDGDVWHIEYMTRGYQVQKKIRDFARQLRESKGATHG